MNIKSACVIGFGTLGKSALEMLMLNAPKLGLEKIVVVDIRNSEEIMDEVANTVSSLTGGFDVSVSVESELPTMQDIYWIALPIKRNVHDSPIEVKPLNKIVAKLQRVIGDESVVINSTITPIGRNAKLFKKLRLDYAGSISWTYVPLDPEVKGLAGYLKVVRRPEVKLHEVFEGLGLRKINPEVLELLTLSNITRKALLAQHTNEMATIANERDVKVSEFMEEYYKITNGECPVSFGGITDIESVAIQMVVDKVGYQSNEANKLGVTPVLNGLVLGSKAFDDYQFKCVVERAHATPPNGSNESQIIIHGSSEQANRLVARLMASVELPEHTRLYQVPYNRPPVPGVNVIDVDRAAKLELLPTTASFLIGVHMNER